MCFSEGGLKRGGITRGFTAYIMATLCPPQTAIMKKICNIRAGKVIGWSMSQANERNGAIK